MIVIDTDVLIEILDKKSEKGGDALNRILQSGEEIATTTINMHEILYGLSKYAKPTKRNFAFANIKLYKERRRSLQQNRV
jgi:tRNA(fMet)-specific endonuclease VapC